MSDFPEASRQSDFIIPGAVGNDGISNVAAVSVSTTATVIDLSTLIAVPLIYGAQVPPQQYNAIGHYVNFQAQGGDMFALFGPSVASLTAGQIPSVTVTAGGTGYTNATTVTFTGGAGSGAAATATVVNGAITAVTMTNNGTGYTSAPAVSFSVGTGATATANLGGPPNATTVNTVNATTGAITSARGPAIWIPQNQTLPLKLILGPGSTPTTSPHRYMSVLVSSGTGTLRIWQSSP